LIETTQDLAENLRTNQGFKAEPLAYLAFARAQFVAPTQTYRVDPSTGIPLIQAISSRLRKVTQLFRARVSEATGADIEHLGLERGHRTLVITRKGGKVVTIPLAPRTAQAIDLAIGERPGGPLFLGGDRRRLDRHGAARVVRRVTRRAGTAKHVSPHTLRHAVITAALDAGVPLREVQDAASHADPRTTMRYDRARKSLDRHATYIVQLTSPEQRGRFRAQIPKASPTVIHGQAGRVAISPTWLPDATGGSDREPTARQWPNDRVTGTPRRVGRSARAHPGNRARAPAASLSAGRVPLKDGRCP
jgi:hypothetical protein